MLCEESGPIVLDGSLSADGPSLSLTRCSYCPPMGALRNFALSPTDACDPTTSLNVAGYLFWGMVTWGKT